MALIQLTSSPVSDAGSYILSEDASKYSVIRAVGQLFEDIKDVIPATSFSSWSLVPPLSSDNDQGYVCTTSSMEAGCFPYRAFNNMNSGWFGAPLVTKGWFQIQNTNGKFRTNMFTFYVGDISSANKYRPNHLQILGSDDGENWNIIVDDVTPYPVVISSSRTYRLEEYVEYSYIRINIVANGGNYMSGREFLIQDSVLHGYDTDSEVSSVFSGSVHSLTIDGHAPMVVDGDDLTIAETLPYAVNIVANSDDIIDVTPKTYRTYKRDANGVPQLVLADVTSVSSGLGKTTLNDDLQSLVTMAKVDDLIAKMDSCTFAGKVTSEDKLPTADVKVGTVYLVGAEDAIEHEEFIYTEDGTWERLGSVRASDVDLSDYTTTEGMNTAISNVSTILEGNLTNMDTSVSGALDDMIVSVEAALTVTNTKVDESMSGITKELKIVDSAPTTWTDDMDDTGIILCVD